MTEVLSERATLNIASMRDTEIGHENLPAPPLENLSMEPIVAAKDSDRDGTARKHRYPADENANQLGVAGSAVLGKESARDNAQVTTMSSEADEFKMGDKLLGDAPESPVDGCHNPAFEPDGLVTKYTQPSYKAEEAFAVEPSDSGHRCFRTAVVVTMVIMACVLIGVVFIIIGYFAALEWSQNGASSSSLMLPSSTPAPPTVSIEVSASLRLQQEYLPAYRDPSTPEYKALERQFVSFMTEIFLGSHLRDSFESVHVTEFEPGSINVKFAVTLNQIPPSAKTVSDASYLQTIIKAEIEYVLTEGVSKGGQSNLVVANDSILVSNVVLQDTQTTVASTRGTLTTTDRYHGVLNSASCGLRPGYTDTPLQRIVQGSRTEWGKWPWLVSLRIPVQGSDEKKRHLCGATLISDRWATTAAHCLSYPSTLATRLDNILAGDLHLEVPSPHRQIIPIERVFTYPGYNPINHVHDLALIKLAQPVELTDYTQPVCLQREQAEVANYRNCYVAGWGFTEWKGNVSAELLDAKMNLVETSECAQSYVAFRSLGFLPTEGSVCSEPTRNEESAGPCSGDSGGPLMCEAEDGRWHLVGVISIGVACNATWIPVVTTRVSAYWDYITAVVDGDSVDVQCEELTSARCSGLLPYRTTHSTSRYDFDSVVEYMVSINRSCSDQIEPLVCSLMYLGCVPGGRTLVPCRDFCEAVVENCMGAYSEAHGIPLEAVVKCHRFPEARNPSQMMCYQDEDMRCGNQSISLPSVGLTRLQSHNFPGSYGSYLDCVYVVTAPSGHRVLAKTRRLSIQQEHVLEIGEGRNTFNKTTILAKFRGPGASPVVLSEGESMWIRFTTGEEETNDLEGYDLELYAVSAANVSALCSNISVDGTLSTPGWWICDGVVDCPSGLDEADCPRKLPDTLNAPTCGLRPSVSPRGGPQYRIINGTKVDPGVWPWLAYLRFDTATNGHINCGASLIGDRWATTAAHCVSSPNAMGLLISNIVIGDVHLMRKSPHHQTVPIARIHTHPGYNPKILTNDIAVLELAQPVEITDYARPVCLGLETGDITHKYTKCYTAGWGHTAYKGNRSDDLLEAQMSLVHLEDCSEKYEGLQMWGITITNRVMCVKSGDTNVLATACNGDSGGPVMCQAADGRWNMVGIISLGLRCSRHPVVVTRVAAYVDYIANIIEGDPYPVKCEALRSETCSNLLPYDRTFPTNQEAFEPVLATLLDNATCPAVNLARFMCTVLFDGCTDDGRARVPCREYCEDVVRQCSGEYQNTTGLSLAGIGRCQRLPDAGQPDQMICFRDEDARCGNQTHILLPQEGSVTLQSHNYPESYDEYLDCTTLVVAPPLHRVLVKAREVDVDACCDTLAFGAGHDAHDKTTTLAKFHGEEDLRVVVSPERRLWVRFTSRSDPRDAWRGYSLEVYAVNETLVPHLCSNVSDRFPYSPPDWWICDGIVDCPGGVDEQGCPTTPAPTTDVVLNQEGCGTQPARASSRIVGGSTAEPGQWPWLGSLRYQQLDGPKKHGCAASLIAPQWVVTAAHCVDSPGFKKGQLSVVFGDPSLNETTPHHVEMAVESLFSHPGYNYITIEHDIALLKLAHPVRYTNHVRPVCLDTGEDEVYNGSSLCYVAGWGLTNRTAVELPNAQQELQVHLLDQQTCVESVDGLGFHGIVTESMTCAEGLDGQSPCRGDSGGALVCRDDHGVWHEVAIISAVFGCSSKRFPGFYTRISPYLDFISSTINGDSRPSCEPLEPSHNCSALVPYTDTFTTTQSFYADMIDSFPGFETCHDHAKEFMCMLLMPRCPLTTVPCRSFCMEFVENCSAVYNNIVPHLLEYVLPCEYFPVGPSPETRTCIRGEDARCSWSGVDGEILVTAENHTVLLSPGYPSYDESLRCTWLVTGPPTSQGLLVKFVTLEYGIEEQNALVIGYGHRPGNLSTLLEQYFGSSKAGPLLVKSRKAWIWYSTGASAHIDSSNDTEETTEDMLGGFKLEIHATNITDINSLCTEPRGRRHPDLTVMPAWWYCDGFPDCPLGVDERDCPSPWYNETYFLNSSTCGRRGSTLSSPSRVVGGTSVSAGTWPWMMSLRSADNKHWCGATLISEYWALSAAHCQELFDHAVLGDLSIYSSSPYHVDVKVKDMYIHKEFNNILGNVDIALLMLARPVQLDDHIDIACLPDPGLVLAENTTCYVTGWGHQKENGSFASILQEAALPILSPARCHQLAPGGIQLASQMMCAGYLEGQVDTCQGDSGGPLLCQASDGRWSVVGVTSFGNGCARPESPGYYTNVATVMDFILAVVSGEGHPMATKREVYP